MGLSYSEDFTVPFEMTDVKQEIIISHLLAQCLAVSSRQSDKLGRSDSFVFDEYGLVWIVTDYELTLSRLPRYNERIQIKTEAISYNKFFCYRTFCIYDEKGRLLVDILCYFVLLDFETRKVVPVPEDVIAPYQSEQVKKLPRAPKYQELENPLSREYKIRYFDIDMNGHVNNGKYLEWMYDALDYDFLLNHFPKKIQLKYIKEVSPNGLILSNHTLIRDTSQHEIRSDGQVHAQARIIWQKRKENEKK